MLRNFGGKMCRMRLEVMDSCSVSHRCLPHGYKCSTWQSIFVHPWCELVHTKRTRRTHKTQRENYGSVYFNLYVFRYESVKKKNFVLNGSMYSAPISSLNAWTFWYDQTLRFQVLAKVKSSGARSATLTSRERRITSSQGLVYIFWCQGALLFGTAGEGVACAVCLRTY